MEYLQNAGYSCTIAPFATPILFRALQNRRQLATKVSQTLYCTLRRLLRVRALKRFDLIVIHREAFPFLSPLVERWILSMHARVVFSFDDAIYNGHDEVSSLNHPLLYRAKYGHGYDEVMRRCVHVIAGNRVLAEHAKRLNPNVSIIPTVVDCRQFKYKSPRRYNHGPLTIGWMGSRSTVRYLSIIEPALRKVAEVHGDRVQFLFVGAPEHKLNVPRARYLSFNLERELHDLHSLDIGLMPMPDTEWTRGKCAFKAIQYMAAGIPTVASPVGIATDVIQHNVTGLLANSTDEWVNGLGRLISDHSLRERLSRSARRTIEQSYSLHVWGPRLVLLLDQLSNSVRVVSDGSVAA